MKLHSIEQSEKYLKIIAMRLMTQQSAIYRECRYITLIIIDNNEALAGHCNIFGREKLLRCIERTQQVSKGCMYKNGTVYGHDKEEEEEEERRKVL